MKTFDGLIIKKIVKVKEKSGIRAKELIEMLEKFGLELNNISEETVEFIIPKNPFNIIGNIKIHYYDKKGRGGAIVKMLSPYTYESILKGFDFSEYDSDDVFNFIVENIKKLIGEEEE